MLIITLACAPDGKPPLHDSAAADSRADSRADSAGESGDTREDSAGGSGDTREDSPGESGDTGAPDDSAADTDAPPPPCFADIQSPVDYASSGAILNATCTGTDHQQITGVQRVVFAGDSVTAGAPIPTDWSNWEITSADEWYRNLLADEFVARWGLEAPGWLWENVDLTSGESYEPLSGDFANCSKWGARTDDLAEDNTQLADCLPAEYRDQRTLLIMTVGGNDLFNLLDHIKNQDVDEATMRAEWQAGIDALSAAIHGLTDDPAQFPGGLDIIVANIFDVTDPAAAADIADCEGAQLIGLSAPLLDPLTAELAIQWQESLLALSAETGIDVAFMGETFCGHGYNRDDTTGRCYRGADPALYFDASCEHPSSDGHAAIAEMMLGVIDG